jgi:hypothetical protein
MRATALALLILLAAPATAGAQDAGEIASALRRDPVYVARGADPDLSVAERGRLRLRIVRRDIGRIKIAVVSERQVKDAGSISDLANAIDQKLEPHGAIIAAQGTTSFHAVLSYSPVEPTIEAIRRAVSSKREKGLEAQLLATVDEVAKVDPGPRADPQPGGGGAVPAPPASDAHEVFGAFKLAVLIVAVAVALPFVLVALWLLLRYRRRRIEEADRLSSDREAAQDELVALGDEIRALDIDVSMPGANRKGVAEYERALALYEHAERELGRPSTELRLSRARAALAEARTCMESASSLLASPPA